MNETECDMKNQADTGRCYPQRPKAELDNTFFGSARLGLSSSANILQIADVALRVVFLLFLLFLAIISP